MPRLAPRQRAAHPSRRLLVLGAVAATAFATGIPAAEAAAPNRTVTAKFASTSGVTSGTVGVSGTLTNSPAGTSVSLQRQTGTTWTTVQTATTVSAGTYTAAVPMPSSAGTYSFRGFVKAKSGLTAAKSATTTITVRTPVAVTLAASPRAVTAGGAVTLSGAVNPFASGGKVTISTVTGTTVQRVAVATIAANGTFTATVDPTGTTTYRATAAASAGYAAGSSPDVTVTVGAAVIVRTTLPAGTVGAAYTGRLTTQGNVAGTWSVTGLAPLVLNSATGAITGTPSRAGGTTVTVAFTVASSGLRDTATFTVHVDPAPTTPAPGSATVSAGGSHSCRVQPDHTLWCWGFNIHGQLGQTVNLQMPFATRPQQVGTATNWLSVSAGSFYDTCGVRSDYTLWCWGWNSNGEAGNGTTNEQDLPVQVRSDQHWRAVTVGDFHACGLTTAGGLWCWGDNGSGQSGLGTLSGATVPTQVGTTSDWTSVSAGGYNTCAVRGRGALYCWGTNYQGQLGIDSTASSVATPTRVGTNTDWTSVDVGGATVCGTRTGGSLWCWGLNRSGSVGDGTTTDRSTPQPVGTGSTWASVTAGEELTCGVRTDGTLWCWGENTNGSVGDGTTGTDRLLPTAVAGGGTWATVSAGGGHACAVAAAGGSQWCWGSNTWGQLGIGTQSNGVAVPTKVAG